MSSVEPFNRLVKLTARAFYDDYDITINGRKGSSDNNKGMAVVILDALTRRRQWVREDDLAKDLKLHSKQLRSTLRFFEEEKLVARDHKKEMTAKGGTKLYTYSYCCLDYSQIYDVVRYRLHRMKKKLKDEMEDRTDTIQEYVCPGCRKRYSAFDALQLISSPDDESFHCGSCNGELVAKTGNDKLAAEEMGDGNHDNASRRASARDLLQKMEEQLKPLIDQLNIVKDLTIPKFVTLQTWDLARATAANNCATNGDFSTTGDPSTLYIGETKVEVALSGAAVKEEDTKPEAMRAGSKVLPPWMIKQGMNLTKEQRGEVVKEDYLKMDGNSAHSDISDDKKSKVAEKGEYDKSIQEEYVKAYYAALLKRQQEQEEAKNRKQEELENKDHDLNTFSNTQPSDRQVGMKSKRQEHVRDDNDNVEWKKEAPTAGLSTDNESYKLNDFNEWAEKTGDDADEIDWEEGQ